MYLYITALYYCCSLQIALQPTCRNWLFSQLYYLYFHFFSVPVWTLVPLNTESVILYRQISALGTLLAYSVRRTCRHYFNVTNYSPRAYWRLCSLKDPLMSLRQRRRCSIYYSDYDSSVCAVTGHFAPRKQPPPWLWFRVRPVLRPVCSTRAELNWTLEFANWSSVPFSSYTVKCEQAFSVRYGEANIFIFIHQAGSSINSDNNNRKLNYKHIIKYYNFLHKKLSYRRGTARCVVSVEILPIATQQCRNYLYDKSWTNRSYEVGGLQWVNL